MKTLTRIRLVNWHYFVNETINIKGSVLISGENTSGKSTILDAIQLVLTTNHRKFNIAANERSNRDLRGYVRGKSGDDNQSYIRTGSVITYVALEFYEERDMRHFTLGVKIDSPDEDSKLSLRWFQENVRLEAISFVTDGRPSTTDECRVNDRRVSWIMQTSEARARFSRRLGDLEDRYFDMIPKSLAFKPMDNVKHFINRFLLSERTIEVASLRNNIASLKELEDLMLMTREKIDYLAAILDKHQEVLDKDQEIRTTDVLIKKADIEAKRQEADDLEKMLHISRQHLAGERDKLNGLATHLNHEQDRLVGYNVALGQNEATMLIKDCQHRIALFNKDLAGIELAMARLTGIFKTVDELRTTLARNGIALLSREDWADAKNSESGLERQSAIFYQLRKDRAGLLETYQTDLVRQRDLLRQYQEQQRQLEQEIRDLKNKKLIYPKNTIRLQQAIAQEFLNRGIHSEPRIFSDLLEITDPQWQNAVEGYLNTQRFYLLVEPQYYAIALSVYDRIKREIHSVGLVNTEKLPLSDAIDQGSLAYVVSSENRWARAYATYLLNRVMRCASVDELKNNPISITADCMLYQNYAVRKISDEVYQTPFIGVQAYVIQQRNKEAQLADVMASIGTAQQNEAKYVTIIQALEACRLDGIDEILDAPARLDQITSQIRSEKEQLRKAENEPGLIQIRMEIDACTDLIANLRAQHEQAGRQIGKLENQIDQGQAILATINEETGIAQASLAKLCDQDATAADLGLKKYAEQIRTKGPALIRQNFMPVLVGQQNRKHEMVNELVKLQALYNSKYDCDLGSGLTEMQDFIEEHRKLVASDMIRYEADLEKAKENCQLEFRESFLARLKENIENARQEFRNLNAALKNIYYGEDSYKFDVSANKQKEKLYQMIMSPSNEVGYNLWSQSFDAEYHDEMEDLFAKLTAYDDRGDKVLEEYTDYRNYLDYDILVEKRSGSVQRFSRIYGEKSGGETQTPYYVAIAASFVQLYKSGDTIRIIMFDEAFDKMDDNRISAMMDFLNSQNFQIIVATPPAKIEVIGEKVDTILMAMREGTTSIVEEYEL